MRTLQPPLDHSWSLFLPVEYLQRSFIEFFKLEKKFSSNSGEEQGGEMRIQHPSTALFIPLTKQQATSATQQLHTKKSHSPSLVSAQRALPHTFFFGMVVVRATTSEWSGGWWWWRDITTSKNNIGDENETLELRSLGCWKMPASQSESRAKISTPSHTTNTLL